MKTSIENRGRPRDPEVTSAILQAALKLLGENGYAGMSVEAVAAAAGVGKTAIYRRYTGKPELAAAAMALARDPGFTPDTGDTRRDLILQLERSQKAMVDGPGLTIMGSLLIEAQRNPDLLDVFSTRIRKPAWDAGARVIRRGIERGDVSPDLDIDAALSAIWGQVAAHFLAGADFTPDWAERAVDVVWNGIAIRQIEQ
jgi:AcrR family transcriptional regulator